MEVESKPDCNKIAHREDAKNSPQNLHHRTSFGTWQKHPEERRYWGMTWESFEQGRNAWREHILREMGG